MPCPACFYDIKFPINSAIIDSIAKILWAVKSCRLVWYPPARIHKELYLLTTIFQANIDLGFQLNRVDEPKLKRRDHQTMGSLNA